MGVNHEKFTENFEKLIQDKEEKEVVIDLAIDRYIKFIGLYAIGILAAATSIFIIAGPVLNCNTWHGANNVAEADFTNKFCWFSKPSDNHLCENHTNFRFDRTEFLDSHDKLRSFYKNFPYLLIAQVVTFLLPSVYWHYQVGSRLIGQINYIQHILKDLFEQVNKVKENEAKIEKEQAKTPFDENSETFRKNKEHKKTATQSQSTSDLNKDFPNNQKAEICYKLISSVQENSNLKAIRTPACNALAGRLQDKHLFSIFCYENFASFVHFSHIVSACRAIGSKRTGKETEIGYYGLKDCILMQWCHERNFSNNILVIDYFLRQLFTAFFSFGYLLGMTLWYLFELRQSELTSARIFKCFLSYLEKDECVLCVVNRKREIFLFYWLDYILLCFILVLSLKQWWSIRNSKDLSICHFLDPILQIGQIVADTKTKPENSLLINTSGQDWKEVSKTLMKFMKRVSEEK